MTSPDPAQFVEIHAADLPGAGVTPTIPSDPALRSAGYLAPDGELREPTPGVASQLPRAGDDAVPTTGPTVVVVAPPRPRATSSTGHVISNVRATWYCNNDPSRGPISACQYHHLDVVGSDQLYVAVSPDLDFLRGRTFTVIYGSRSVVVTAIDCDCQATHAIDLYADAFVRLRPLSSGSLTVTIRW